MARPLTIRRPRMAERHQLHKVLEETLTPSQRRRRILVRSVVFLWFERRGRRQNGANRKAYRLRETAISIMYGCATLPAFLTLVS